MFTKEHILTQLYHINTHYNKNTKVFRDEGAKIEYTASELIDEINNNTDIGKAFCIAYERTALRPR